jgi:hypothetical protein
VLAVAVLAVLADITVLSSRVSLVAPHPFMVGDPFSTRFELINNGNFAVRDVHLMAKFSGRLSWASFEDISFTMHPAAIQRLPAGEAYAQGISLVWSGLPLMPTESTLQ